MFVYLVCFHLLHVVTVHSERASFRTNIIIEISTSDCGTSSSKTITNILVHKQWYPTQENIINL